MRHLFTDRRQTPGGQGTFAEGSDRPTFSYMLLRLNLNEVYSNQLPGICNTLLNFFIRSFLDQGPGQVCVISEDCGHWLGLCSFH